MGPWLRERPSTLQGRCTSRDVGRSARPRTGDSAAHHVSGWYAASLSSPDPDDDGLGQTVVLGVEHGSAILAGSLQVVVIGNGTYATHPLQDGAAVTLGRSSRCDIVIDDESMSRQHAILNLGETATIEDLGSRNGTVVRGQRIPARRPTEIAVGEPVGLGKVSIILQQSSTPVRANRLCSHAHFEAFLDAECRRARRSGSPFGLLRIHADRRAQPHLVEGPLSELLRNSDIVGKAGSFEYEALLLDTAPSQADQAVRRIEAKLLERGIECRFVLACCPRDGLTPEELSTFVQPRAPETTSPPATDIVVFDPQMRALHRLLEQVAASNINVLLLGETGVGKEVFARALHRASPRAAGPFVDINCAALTETLLESELFGHEKGAFTNALTAKPGLLESAQGGTVLLDEIGDMPLTTQVKLLRVIEDSQLRRVGALKTRPIDVRFVAATNCDLEHQVAEGTFRRDLFYRLNGAMLVIPPLRERRSELEPMLREFIARAKRGCTGALPALTPEALELLEGYTWPGNVRELKNVVERALSLCGDGPILPEHLPRSVHVGEQPIRQSIKLDAPPPRVSDVARHGLSTRRTAAEEQHWILDALERTAGNQTCAARLLGISRRTLVNRLNDYKVDRPRKGSKQRDD